MDGWVRLCVCVGDWCGRVALLYRDYSPQPIQVMYQPRSTRIEHSIKPHANSYSQPLIL
jgi:hypothetical protein